MFCEIKSVAFKIKVLTCLLLYRSLENVIRNIAANANGLSSVSGIRNLVSGIKNVIRKEIKHYLINF